MSKPNGQDRWLTDALRAMAVDDRARAASPAVEARLRTEVHAIHRARRRRAMTMWSAAALLAVVVAVPAWRASRRSPGADASRGPAAAAETATGFLPLPYSGVPMTNGQLVRLQVPLAALASFGLAPIEAQDVSAAETVSADVLVGEDGLARAIRFVRTVEENGNP